MLKEGYLLQLLLSVVLTTLLLYEPFRAWPLPASYHFVVVILMALLREQCLLLVRVVLTSFRADLTAFLVPLTAWPLPASLSA